MKMHLLLLLALKFYNFREEINSNAKEYLEY